jgi:hypothetical protein
VIERHRSIFWLLGDLIVNELIVEADARCLGGRVAVDNAVETRPVRRGETQRAGVAARVQGAAVELELVELGARPADDGDFGVRGRVVGRRDEIPAVGDDFAGLGIGDDGAEGTAVAGEHVLLGKGDRSLQVGFVEFCNVVVIVCFVCCWCGC